MSDFIFWSTIIYIGIPIMFESVNKLLWKPLFFLVNYFFTIILAISTFFLENDSKLYESRFFGMLVTPFMFLSLYKIVDILMLKKFGRHFIITNRSMSKVSWSYDWKDQVYSILIFISSVLMGLFCRKLAIYL